LGKAGRNQSEGLLALCTRIDLIPLSLTATQLGIS
jgi:hypothetical protein